MQTVFTETTEVNNVDVDFQKRNNELQHMYSNSKKDLQKRNDLREYRLQQINEYREEQVAALKH